MDNCQQEERGLLFDENPDLRTPDRDFAKMTRNLWGETD